MTNLLQRNDICVTVDHISSKIAMSTSMNFAFLVQTWSVVWVDLQVTFCGQQHPKCRPIICFVNSRFFCKVRFHQTHKQKYSEHRSGQKREGTILRARFKHLYFGNHNGTHAHIFLLTMTDTVTPQNTDLSSSNILYVSFSFCVHVNGFLPKLEFGRAEFRCYMQHVYNINFDHTQNYGTEILYALSSCTIEMLLLDADLKHTITLGLST